MGPTGLPKGYFGVSFCTRAGKTWLAYCSHYAWRVPGHVATFFLTINLIGRGAISLGIIQNMPTQSKFTLFQGFLKFRSNAPQFPFTGGVCAYFLKTMRKGSFKHVWVRGG